MIPARPGKAKDRARVESMVQVAQRWILARGLQHPDVYRYPVVELLCEGRLGVGVAARPPARPRTAPP